MTYMPTEPELRDDKQDKPDERRRRRIARLLGAGAVSILARWWASVRGAS